MTADRICTENSVYGRIALWRINPKTNCKSLILAQSNQVQYAWGYLAAKTLGLRPQPDQPRYHISAIYFEFENVLTPETVVTEAQSFPKDLNTN